MMNQEDLGDFKIAASLVDKTTTAESEIKEMGMKARTDKGRVSFVPEPRT